jgi:transglutaminase-like putative cysteine protease
VTYSFEFSPDPNTTDRTKDLKVWLPLPREWDSQTGVEILSIDPPPHARYEDPEFGNRMLFWDFGKDPAASSYRAVIKFRLESYKTLAEVDPAKIGAYDKTSEEYGLYTRDEHTIAITQKVRELAKEAVGEEKNPYLQARRIHEFVEERVQGEILDFERGRGIECLLAYPIKDGTTGKEYYAGCCSHQSALFVAMCRAVGIPARAVSGFQTRTPMLYGKRPKPRYWFETRLSPTGMAGAQLVSYLQGHVWSEFYLPNIGWIPADQSNFGSLDNWRFILTKGRDVKIGPECPEQGGEGYGSHWVPLWNGRADLFFHAVWNIAKIRSPRVTVTISREP